MKKITLAVMLLLTLHCYSQPLTTTLPAVWLRADSIGPESHYWGDVTGHGHHAYPMGGQLPVLTGKMNYNHAWNGSLFSCIQLSGISLFVFFWKKGRCTRRDAFG